MHFLVRVRLPDFARARIRRLLIFIHFMTRGNTDQVLVIKHATGMVGPKEALAAEAEKARGRLLLLKRPRKETEILAQSDEAQGVTVNLPFPPGLPRSCGSCGLRSRIEARKRSDHSSWGG